MGIAASRIVLTSCGVLLAAAVAAAQDASPAGAAPTLAVRYAFKASVLTSRLPGVREVFPDRDNASGLARLRIEPTIRWGETAAFELAVEQRVQAFTNAAGEVGSFVLPTTAPAPYRVRPLDWSMANGSNGFWRLEIDRAAGHLHGARADVTIGRQAVGWGRGAMFGAVDLFSPFTPLEADREWRRGIDAVRADVRLTDRASIDTVAAFGRSMAASTFATRVRGYTGRADVEVAAGYRAADGFAGVTSSAPIGDIELHGELAMFRTPARPGSLDFGAPRTVTKAVAGGSYRIPVAHGVLAYVEYHYSGFGAASPERIAADLRDPEFQKRYLRGDSQILGRHASAVSASYEWSPQLTLSTHWILNPADGSGVIVPTLTWTGSDGWSLTANGYVPHGKPPVAPVLRSEYGASPLAALLQVRVYR